MPQGVVLKDAFVEIQAGTVSTDISTFLTEARLTLGRDGVEDTSVGDDTHTMVPGLGNHGLQITLKQGYETGGPEQTITPLVIAGTEIKVEVRRSRTASVSATNPRFRMEGAVITGADYSPIGGRVGELVTSSLQISPTSGHGWARTTT